MDKAMTTEEIAVMVKDWCLYRITNPELKKEDARALVAEFYEWLDPAGEQVEVFSLDAEK